MSSGRHDGRTDWYDCVHTEGIFKHLCLYIFQKTNIYFGGENILSDFYLFVSYFSYIPQCREIYRYISTSQVGLHIHCECHFSEGLLGNNMAGRNNAGYYLYCCRHDILFTNKYSHLCNISIYCYQCILFYNFIKFILNGDKNIDSHEREKNKFCLDKHNH